MDLFDKTIAIMQAGLFSFIYLVNKFVLGDALGDVCFHTRIDQPLSSLIDQQGIINIVSSQQIYKTETRADSLHSVPIYFMPMERIIPKLHEQMNLLN